MRERSSTSKQRGASFLGWLLIVVAVGSAAVLGLRLVPHYIDYQTIVSVVDAPAGGPRAHDVESGDP